MRSNWNVLIWSRLAAVPCSFVQHFELRTSSANSADNCSYHRCSGSCNSSEIAEFSKGTIEMGKKTINPQTLEMLGMNENKWEIRGILLRDANLAYSGIGGEEPQDRS